MLIGIAGHAHVGKDTVGLHLERNHWFQRMAFADPVKWAAASIFGVRIEVFYDPKQKEAMNHYWGITHREMLQQVGEGMRSIFGRDVWIKRWASDYAARLERNPDRLDVVVTDVRHNEEADAIRLAGGHVIHLFREGVGLTGKAAEHVSEQGILFYQGDKIIDNDGSIADLYAKVDITLAALKEPVAWTA